MLNGLRLLVAVAVIMASVLLLGFPAPEVIGGGAYTPSPYDGSLDKCVLSSALNDDGEPLNPADTFAPDTSQIICSFWLAGDLCCTSVRFKWQFPDATVIWDEKNGDNLSRPDNVSLARPENGFPVGNYTVTIYLGTWEVISVPFTVG